MNDKRASNERYVVQAVDRALDVLEAFHGGEETSLNAICKRVGLNKSRTFRLLCTLSRRGYVERTPNGLGYTLGLKLFERAAHFRRDLKQSAYPFMDRLRKEFNETVNLAVIHAGKLLYLNILESSQPFRMAAVIGSQMPIHTTSLGKSMLAYSREDEFATLVKALTPAELRKLKKEIEIVRERGYAWDREENEPGVSCIGAPIFDHSEQPVAALSISGPTGRMVSQERDMSSAICQSCREVSRQLGFSGLGRVRNGGKPSYRMPRGAAERGLE
ncbi:MAG TPA: IclR family transcriptional regulator [Candidatus Aquilonibacter sp.]|nr:IclR family transcriptional regulator [Candidatus Aquilonibacter sp.]